MIFKAAIVADIDFAVRTHRRTIRAATGFCDQLLGSVGQDPGELLGFDFDQNNTAVGHGDRAFGKAQAFGDYLHDHLLFIFVSVIAGIRRQV